MRRACLEAPDFETASVYLSYLAARAEIPEDELLSQFASGQLRITLNARRGRIIYEPQHPWIWVEGDAEWVAYVLEKEG